MGLSLDARSFRSVGETCSRAQRDDQHLSTPTHMPSRLWLGSDLLAVRVPPAPLSPLTLLKCRSSLWSSVQERWLKRERGVQQNDMVPPGSVPPQQRALTNDALASQVRPRCEHPEPPAGNQPTPHVYCQPTPIYRQPTPFYLPPPASRTV